MISANALRAALLTIATGLVSLTANFAAAAPIAEARQSVVVPYSDLDLSRPADARRLYSRIKSAADSVCNDGSNNSLARLSEYHTCVMRAVTDAVAAVNSLHVTEIHRAEGRRI